ncbi:hypothetical protein PR003_g1038 [Phytophthora rubi]|uniref:Uncharacterized protein n=1 Tax=Phytophthora rubi TaxID=129364 RepID=A0A6A3NSM8_9STRA|nr:hypothetical protein PR002_g963 [Phytophthora rubi]KAE9051787.1 hypothetical protein PR001_g1113 [Phytophthora rubi]KAE9358925.1 hypothetical protein PR003_g1038 [Phytophthora rubi]
MKTKCTCSPLCSMTTWPLICLAGLVGAVHWHSISLHELLYENADISDDAAQAL